MAINPMAMSIDGNGLSRTPPRILLTSSPSLLRNMYARYAKAMSYMLHRYGPWRNM
ncbi:MAG: hypothetical protein NDF58_08030 [archaeon YNP-LCB-024-027]|nr:hypothetical protein [Candidatus Culexarchaeum yellowstonense]